MSHRDNLATLHLANLGIEWKRHYESRLVTAQEAVSHIKSGDRVAFARGREPQALGLALAARKDELKGVKVHIPQPGRDFGWYDNDWSDSFEISIGINMVPSRQAVSDRYVTIRLNSELAESSALWGSIPGLGADVLLVEVSPPDEHGFCSFGASVWDKKRSIETAKVVLAEVNPRLIRTFGDNSIHVSQVDYFVPNEAPTGWGILTSPKEAPPHAQVIADLVGSLVDHGDTIQVGMGAITEWVPRLGAFDNKLDLGLHTEITPRGMTKLVVNGVITGKHKTIHQWKCVATAAGGTKEDVQFINNNPIFELYPMYDVIDPRIISAHDNMVAINQAMAIDLTGQITAEGLGAMQWSGAGGQPIMAMGALLSKGGRSITLVPSTAQGGKVSRIVPLLTEGTPVTVPRYMADIIVSEYGIAKLRWKTHRERAMELIKIAHPDFRKGLEKAARSRFWPD